MFEGEALDMLHVQLVVEFKSESGENKRVKYQPRTDASGWWRITEIKQGDSWSTTHREPLDEYDVALEALPMSAERRDQTGSDILEPDTDHEPSSASSDQNDSRS